MSRRCRFFLRNKGIEVIAVMVADVNHMLIFVPEIIYFIRGIKPDTHPLRSGIGLKFDFATPFFI